MQHKEHKNKGHTKHAEAISSKHKITKRYTKTEFKKVFLFLSYLIKCKNNIHKAEDLKLNTFL
jgi:hypothetical protein